VRVQVRNTGRDQQRMIADGPVVLVWKLLFLQGADLANPDPLDLDGPC